MKANNFKNRLVKALDMYWTIREYSKVILKNGTTILNCFEIEETLYVTISDVYLVIYNKQGQIEHIRDTKDYKNEMEATVEFMYMMLNKLP